MFAGSVHLVRCCDPKEAAYECQPLFMGYDENTAYHAILPAGAQRAGTLLSMPASTVHEGPNFGILGS